MPWDVQGQATAMPATPAQLPFRHTAGRQPLIYAGGPQQSAINPAVRGMAGSTFATRAGLGGSAMGVSNQMLGGAPAGQGMNPVEQARMGMPQRPPVDMSDPRNAALAGYR